MYVHARDGEETSDGNGRQRRPHVYVIKLVCFIVYMRNIRGDYDTRRDFSTSKRAHTCLYIKFGTARLLNRGCTWKSESFDYVITIAPRKHFRTSRIGEL